MFTNPPFVEIAALLRRARVIAVVGLSADTERPSHRVAKALQEFGYRIIPVTPTTPEILGERSVPDLDHLSTVVGDTGPVDIVDVFRPSGACGRRCGRLHPARTAGAVAAGGRSG